jgi:parallel beta-helix repeat protein
MKSRRILSLVLSLTLCLAALVIVLSLVGDPARAQGSTRYVATTGTDDGACTDSNNPCRTVQYAVDEAADSDVIKVATGVYNDIHLRPPPPGYPNPPTSGLVTQTVYLSKTLTIRGGYTVTDWIAPNPEVNPATLDAQAQGRVLLVAGTISPTIEGLRITGGDASGLGGFSSLDAGGGVYAISSTVVMSGSQVLSNTAGYNGFGGGLFFLNSSNAVLQDNIISHNRAFQGGGLWCNICPGAWLSNNIISDNEANRLSGGMKHYGGLLFHGSDNIRLDENTVSDNYAANQCGGICLNDSDNATLTHNVIISNSAGSTGFVVSEGGGLRFVGCANATLIGNRISGNSTNTFGGGLYAASSTMALTAGTISSNEATQGGGLYLSSSDVTLSAVTITANAVFSYPHYQLGGDGGGVYLNNGSVVLTNTIVATNEAETAGSGLFIQGQDSRYRMLHTTIASNNGDHGSGVYVTGAGSRVVLTNTILVSHTVGITAAVGNTVTLDSVLWYNNTQNTGGGGTISVTRAYTGNPAFVNPDGGDYHIGPGSAAVNAGIDAGVTTDIDGDPRPDWCFFDIGADELFTGKPCHRLYLPLVMRNHRTCVPIGEELTYDDLVGGVPCCPGLALMTTERLLHPCDTPGQGSCDANGCTIIPP